MGVKVSSACLSKSSLDLVRVNIAEGKAANFPAVAPLRWNLFCMFRWYSQYILFLRSVLPVVVVQLERGRR